MWEYIRDQVGVHHRWEYITGGSILEIRWEYITGASISEIRWEYNRDQVGVNRPGGSTSHVGVY